MSKLVVEINLKAILSVLALIFVLAMSVYTIVLDATTRYEWFYPLDTERNVGTYYPKFERKLFIHNLALNETVVITFRGLELGGQVVSPSNSSYLKAEYTGFNVYVVTIAFATSIVETYAYVKTRKKVPVYALFLFAIVTVVCIIAQVAMVYYVQLGSRVGYTVIERPASGRLIGPFDIGNVTAVENIGDIIRLLRELGYRYLYLCPRESVQETSLVYVKLSAPTILTIPVVRIGDLRTLNYTSASYTQNGEIWCALLSIIEVNATYTVHRLEFRRGPAEDFAPLVSTLPAVLVTISLGTAVLLSTYVKKLTRSSTSLNSF